MTVKLINNFQFDEERALYKLKCTRVCDCIFKGTSGGESALKEAGDVIVDRCDFASRYPLWHSCRFVVRNSLFGPESRAPIWYGCNGIIEKSTINSVKALRQCSVVNINNCCINSDEFGWNGRCIDIRNSQLRGVYGLLNSKNIRLQHVDLTGQYCLQYTNNVVIENCVFDTKDALWHSCNVIAKNCIFQGEYLGWFSDQLTLINCHIVGSQPLCHCKNLNLINCTMERCNLAFECSDVNAKINSTIDSIKNPRSGIICCKGIGDVVCHQSSLQRVVQ